MNGAPPTVSRTKMQRPEPGLGVPCCEAQSDGVPCPAHDCDCNDCERARAAGEPRPTRQQGDGDA